MIRRGNANTRRDQRPTPNIDDHSHLINHLSILDRASERPKLNPRERSNIAATLNHEFSYITRGLIEKWNLLPKKHRLRTNPGEFALNHNVHASTFFNYVNSEGRQTALGRQFMSTLVIGPAAARREHQFREAERNNTHQRFPYESDEKLIAAYKEHCLRHQQPGWAAGQGVDATAAMSFTQWPSGGESDPDRDMPGHGGSFPTDFLSLDSVVEILGGPTEPGSTPVQPGPSGLDHPLTLTPLGVAAGSGLAPAAKHVAAPANALAAAAAQVDGLVEQRLRAPQFSADATFVSQVMQALRNYVDEPGDIQPSALAHSASLAPETPPAKKPRYAPSNAAPPRNALAAAVQAAGLRSKSAGHLQRLNDSLAHYINAHWGERYHQVFDGYSYGEVVRQLDAPNAEPDPGFVAKLVVALKEHLSEPT